MIRLNYSKIFEIKIYLQIFKPLSLCEASPNLILSILPNFATDLTNKVLSWTGVDKRSLNISCHQGGCLESQSTNWTLLGGRTVPSSTVQSSLVVPPTRLFIFLTILKVCQSIMERCLILHLFQRFLVAKARCWRVEMTIQE